jgi:hypothetical protein
MLKWQCLNMHWAARTMIFFGDLLVFYQGG